MFFVTLVIGGLVTADWLWRSIEMSALVERVEASEYVMVTYQANVSDAFDDHAEDPVTLEEDLQELSKQAADDLAQVASPIADQPIALWHSDIERARQAYLLHNKAWQAYMVRASSSAEELLLPQEEVDSTFLKAEQPFRDAVPIPDAAKLMDRIDAIFAPPAVEEEPGSTLST